MCTITFSHFHEFEFILGILAQAAGDQVVFILNAISTGVEDAQMKETDFKCAVIQRGSQP